MSAPSKIGKQVEEEDARSECRLKGERRKEKGERIERGGGEDGGRVDGEGRVGRGGVCFSDGEKRWLVLSRGGKASPILLAVGYGT
jgi:hypothetical protein